MRVAVVWMLLLLSGLAIWMLAQGSVATVSEPTAPIDAAPLVPGGGPTNATPAAVDATHGALESLEARMPAQVSPDIGGGEPVVVRALHAETREPLPQTEILWLDDGFDFGGMTAAQRDRHLADAEQFRRELGYRAVTDDVGRVVLRARKRLNLMARKGPLFAQGYWNVADQPTSESAYPGEVILLLAQDQNVRVRVVDQTGRPTGNILIRLMRTVTRAGGGTGRIQQDFGLTNDEGIVVLRHMQTVLNDKTVSADVFGLIAAAETNHATFAPDNIPVDGVELTLPAFGTVAVTLLGADGQRWQLPDKHRVSAVVNPADWQGGQLNTGIDHKLLDADGQTTFRVACGKNMQARIYGGWAPMATFEGPKLDGDQVAVALTMPADTRLVTGRILSAGGEPFSGDVAMEFDTDGKRDTRQIDRYADGRFCFPLGSRIGARPTIRVHEQEPPTGAPLQAEVALRSPLVVGRNELGDIVLTEAPLLVAGQLVFAGDRESAVDPTDISVTVQRRANENEHWENANELQVAINDQQRFEVRTLRTQALYRLVVRGQCAEMPPIPFVPGSDDLRIEIYRGGSVAATFLADDPWGLLTFRLVAANPIEQDLIRRDWRETSDAKEEAGRLHVAWRNLAAGTYRLLVHPVGQPPITSIELDVPKGVAVQDPRLQDIDLRGKIRQITIKVANAQGQHLPTDCAVVLHRDFGDDGYWDGISHNQQTPDGVNFGLAAPTDMYVCAAGYRGVHLRSVFESQTVALVAAATIKLRWVQAQPLPEGVRAQLRWHPAGWPAKGPHLLVRRGSAASGSSAASQLMGDNLPGSLEDGQATARMESAVPLELQLYLYKSGKPAQNLAPILAIDPSHLSEGQVIDLHTDATVVAAALRALAN